MTIRNFNKIITRISSFLYVPVLFILTLIFNLAWRENTAIALPFNLHFATWLLYNVTIALSILPLGWSIWTGLRAIRRRILRQQNNHSGPEAQKTDKAVYGENGLNADTLRSVRFYAVVILVLGIICSHVSTILAIRAGNVGIGKLYTLLFYDLVILDVLYYAQKEKSLFVKGLKVFCVLIGVTALYGIAEHFGGEGFPLLYNYAGNGSNRIQSVYSHAIPAGSMFLVGFWLASLFTERWIRIILRILFILATAFTISKNAWIGLAVSAGICGFVYRHIISAWIKENRKKCMAVIIALAAGGTAVVFTPWFRNVVSVRWMNFQTEGSFFYRVDHIRDVLEYFLHEASWLHRIIGCGFGTSVRFIKNSAHYYGISVIDNQYFTWLYEFGIAAFAASLVWVIRILRKTGSGDRITAACAFALSALLFPFATYDSFGWKVVMLPVLILSTMVFLSREDALVWKTVYTYRTIGCAVFAAGGAALYPWILSWTKTVVQLAAAWILSGRELTGIGRWTIFMTAGVYVLTGLFAVLLYRRNRKGMITAAAALILVFLAGEGIILAQGRRQAVLMEEEAEVLKTVVDAAQGKVFADDIPLLYDRKNHGIHASIFEGENLYSGNTVSIITPRTYESQFLFSKGFLFLPVSEKHALYTDDQAVIRALQEQGRHLTAYYPLLRAVSEDLRLYEGTYEIYAAAEEEGHEAAQMNVLDELQLHYVLTSTQDGSVLAEDTVSASQTYQEEIGPVFHVPVTVPDAGLDLKGNAAGCSLSVQDTSGREPVFYCQAAPAYDRHFVLNSSDRLAREEYYSTDGTPVLNDDGYFAAEYDYNRLFNTETRFYGTDGSPILRSGGYASVRRTYTKSGRTKKETYFGTEGENILNDSGYHSVKNKWDKQGNIVEQRLYGLDDSLIMIEDGYAVWRKNYNEENRVVREEYFDAEGNPARRRDGWSAVTYTYDGAGNFNLIRYYDTDGTPVIVRAGYAQIERNYNEANQMIRERYLDAEGGLIKSTAGYAVNTREYDGRGNAVIQEFFDEHNLPVITTSGFAKVRRTFDDDGHITRETWFGTDGKPLLMQGGYASADYIYDAEGNQTDVYYYDINGDRTKVWNSYAGIHRKFDEKGRITEEMYMDSEGNYISRNEGYAVNMRRYDEKGNAVVQLFTDPEGTPVVRTDGYAQINRTFNAKKQIIEETYCGVQGEKVILPTGYTTTKYSYDADGNQVDAAFFDSNGQPAYVRGLYARLHRMFNDARQIISEEYQDADGKPVIMPDNFSSVERSYDNAGNMIQQRYLDMDGKPVLIRSGYAVLCREHDEGRRIIREYYLGVNGEPVNNAEGYAGVENVYDEKGQLQESRHYDKDGNPV